MTDNKKIDVLGICVDNYTVRESLLRLDTYLGSTVLNIIETVTIEKLISSGENPVIRECLQQADLSIIGESEILTETGNATAQRMREVCDQDFLHELLKKMVRGQKRVFLLVVKNRHAEQIEEAFLKWVPGFSFAGSFSVEESADDMDTIVNEINGATPDIVISALGSPMEEAFLMSHKDKIGTGVWYGIGDICFQRHGKALVGRTLKKIALRGKLRHFVSRYRQSMNENRK